MLLGARQTIFGKHKSYPFDYRVEYFEIAKVDSSSNPMFNIGVLSDFNPNWYNGSIDYNSNFQMSLYRGFSAYAIFSFPKSLSYDQKIFGNPGQFCFYPYSSRYNFGGFNTWMGQSYYIDYNVSEVGQPNTTTRVDVFCDPDSLDVRSPFIGAVTQNNLVNRFIADSKPNHIFDIQNHCSFVIFGYNEGSNFQTNNLYVGTRFYDLEMNFTTGDENELHLHFLPVIKDNKPYICELFSGKMTPIAQGGEVIYGAEVPINYVSISKPSIL